MRSKAFTLVEIMVVVAIIAVIAAIAFPVWASAKKRAKETETVSNLKQTWMALEMYRQDWDGNGKFVGAGHELGLPNQDGFAQLVSKLNLHWLLTPGRVAYGPIFYPVDPSDLTPGYEQPLEARLAKWKAYNSRNENNSVIVGDFNHTEGCAQFPRKDCFFRGFGITLDGGLQKKQATGMIHFPGWWQQ